MTKKLRRRQLGQSMVEFNLALPFLVPVILVSVMLLIQWGLIYRTQVTLNAAAIKAVRQGTLHHGSVNEMNNGLAHGMSPLFARGTDLSDSISAVLQARAAVALQGRIKVLNPDKAVFDRFKKRIRHDGRDLWEIPNNNLMYRDPNLLSIDKNRTLNIQDANLLQIEVDWCEPLIVPVANRVMEGILTSLWYRPSAAQLRCNALGTVGGNPYIAIKAQALMRMQTPFRM
ncbi:TadE family protein [Gallaecimonas sp. GXIMD4217]|uniref:TadE family protein n=1 Tax=Gallaecimonas sp. GXIMD4217 TaxID=3131927 RepID=UPI00311B36D4